jgi:hypothetical protein
VPNVTTLQFHLVTFRSKVVPSGPARVRPGASSRYAETSLPELTSAALQRSKRELKGIERPRSCRPAHSPSPPAGKLGPLTVNRSAPSLPMGPAPLPAPVKSVARSHGGAVGEGSREPGQAAGESSGPCRRGGLRPVFLVAGSQAFRPGARSGAAVQGNAGRPGRGGPSGGAAGMGAGEERDCCPLPPPPPYPPPPPGAHQRTRNGRCRMRGSRICSLLSRSHREAYLPASLRGHARCITPLTGAPGPGEGRAALWFPHSPRCLTERSTGRCPVRVLWAGRWCRAR